MNRAALSSQQVAWWEVHEYVTDVLRDVEHWPLIGTPAWCLLDDDDPQKWAALLDAAQHWALRVETCQQATADAASAISAAQNWGRIAHEQRLRREVYIPRKPT